MTQLLATVDQRIGTVDRTLVVDPDPEYVEIIRTTLRREASHIESADSVTSAVNVLRRQRQDMVIIDRGAPDNRSALDLTRALRQTRPEVALVITSESHLTVAEVVACFEAGADEYIEKPFHPLEFAARIGAVARRAKRACQQEQPPEVATLPA